jgi:hypothetical protein
MIQRPCHKQLSEIIHDWIARAMRRTDSCRKSARRRPNASSSCRALPVPLSSSSAVAVHAARVLSAFTLAILMLLSPAGSVRAGGTVPDCTEASLRSALAGGGTVTFTNDCNIALTGQIFINQATTIDAGGHNVLIGSSNAVPLFDVAANLTLRGVSLVNGVGTNTGGALFIQPGAAVTASFCVFSGNTVVGTNGLAGANGTTNSSYTGGNASSGTQGAAGLGGAIYNLGSLVLLNCTLNNNTATGGDGGSGGAGGTGAGTFSIGGNGGNGATGGAGFGGAIYNLGDLTLINCAFSGNIAAGGSGGAGGAAGAGSSPGLPGGGALGGAGAGGAVYNAMNLTVLASTFASNSAHGGTTTAESTGANGTGLHGIKGATASGGALYNNWWAALTNCTFFTNSVVGGPGGTGGNGGGTFVVPGDGGDGGDGFGGALNNANTITIVSCTLASNGAFGGTNGVPGSGSFSGANGKFGQSNGGSIANNTSVILTLMNSILAASVAGANEFGSFTDAGYNLSSDAAGSFGGKSLQNTDPKLGVLATNGGPTLTMALLAGSPAIDKIPASDSPATDQRGFPRPVNGLADIGAFEFGAAPVVSHVTLSLARTTNKLFQLSGDGTSGLTYLIQTSTNLAYWQTVSTNVAPILFTDPVTNLPTRFYRITR